MRTKQRSAVASDKNALGGVFFSFQFENNPMSYDYRNGKMVHTTIPMVTTGRPRDGLCLCSAFVLFFQPTTFDHSSYQYSRYQSAFYLFTTSKRPTNRDHGHLMTSYFSLDRADGTTGCHRHYSYLCNSNTMKRLHGLLVRSGEV